MAAEMRFAKSHEWIRPEDDGVATVGMIIGGVLAAPFGAMIVRRVRPEWLLRAVSIVLIATSAFAIWKAWPIF